MKWEYKEVVCSPPPRSAFRDLWFLYGDVVYSWFPIFLPDEPRWVLNPEWRPRE